MLAAPAELANKLAAPAQGRGLTVVVAESCTAGELARILSDAEGAASFFHGGFVTYTKRHKSRAATRSAGSASQSRAATARCTTCSANMDRSTGTKCACAVADALAALIDAASMAAAA